MIGAGDPLASLRLSIVGLVHRQGSEDFNSELATTIERWILREPVDVQADGSGGSPVSSEGTQSRGNGPDSRRTSRDTSSRNHS